MYVPPRIWLCFSHIPDHVSKYTLWNPPESATSHSFLPCPSASPYFHHTQRFFLHELPQCTHNHQKLLLVKPPKPIASFQEALDNLWILVFTSQVGCESCVSTLAGVVGIRTCVQKKVNQGDRGCVGRCGYDQRCLPKLITVGSLPLVQHPRLNQGNVRMISAFQVFHEQGLPKLVHKTVYLICL